MRFILSLAFPFTFAIALHAAAIGISVNGVCQNASCPPSALAFGSNATEPINVTTTLANGDMYLINGSFTTTNSSNGNFSTGHLFQVTYEGNTAGGSSAADTINVEAFYTLLSTGGSTVFNRSVLGAFGPGIASSSSASSCVNLTLGCVGPVTPPGSFSPGASLTVTSANGAFVYDPVFTNNFGAGSAVGSYIVWGQTTAIPPPPTTTPEPSSIGLLALGLAAIAANRRRI